MTEPTQPPAPGTPQAGSEGQEQKPGEGGGNPPAPPLPAKGSETKYELKVPEGSFLDKADVERIAAYARERGLSQEDAQKVLERDNANLASFAGRQSKMQEDARNSWAESTKTDKELGGENLPKVVETAKRVLDRFGSEEFKKQLNETGLGNHPELIRILYRVGKVLSNDTTILGGAPRMNVPKTAAEVIYGNTEEK